MSVNRLDWDGVVNCPYPLVGIGPDRVKRLRLANPNRILELAHEASVGLPCCKCHGAVRDFDRYIAVAKTRPSFGVYHVHCLPPGLSGEVENAMIEERQGTTDDLG